jgi:lipopolysaccharide export system permease protein
MRLRWFPHHTLLSRYIIRAHIGPFLFSFFTVMFLFLLQFVMKFIDQLIGKGLTAWVIIELIALNLAWMVVLAVPMSVLVATLMAFGEMSSRNEITIMKASGMSIYRMMAPVLAASALVALLLVWFNNYVLPEANHRLKTLTIDIRRKKPTLTIIAGVFSQDIPGYSILVRKTFEQSNEIEGITLYDYSNPNRNVVVTAERGMISFSRDYRKLIMDLQRGEIHQLGLQQKTEYRKIRFVTHRLVMDVEGFDFERSAEGTFSRGDRELGAGAMRAIVDSLTRDKDAMEHQLQERVSREFLQFLGDSATVPAGGTAMIPGHTPLAAALARTQYLAGYVGNEIQRLEFVNRQINQYMVEIHKKYAIPAACIVFVLVGLPLGIMSRRGGFGVAATLSLGFFVLYWACLIGGEKLADRNVTSPFLGMWIANIFIGVLGAILTVKIGRETVVIQWDLIRRLIPASWQKKWGISEEEQAAQA